MPNGKLFVLSGPSGSGKSTIVNKVLENRDDIGFSVSVTTRDPREGEKNGVNYYYIDDAEFNRMVEAGELLEHAGYSKHYYGTPRGYVEKMLAEGKKVLLDVEIQGARQIAELIPDAVFIFLSVPSIDDLRSRIVHRNQNSAEEIEIRLARALEEIKETKTAKLYSYIIINDDADTAAAELRAIIDGTEEAENCRFEDRKHILDRY